MKPCPLCLGPTSRSRRQFVCRPCENERLNRRRNARKRATMEKVVAYLLEHPCVDCGETDWQVLDFDHRDPGTKCDHVARLVHNASWATVLQEIEKCDVRCANCHRRKTALDNDWYAYFGNGVARMQ